MPLLVASPRLCVFDTLNEGGTLPAAQQHLAASYLGKDIDSENGHVPEVT